MAQPAATVSDLVLVDRCLDGERDAHSELFRRHQRRVHAALYRVLGNDRDMDDLLQETFIQVFGSLAGFRGEAKLSTWIDRIAMRVAFRYLSRRRAAAAIVGGELDDETAGGGPVPREQSAAREGVRRLYAALAELPAASRIAFALHAIDGRSVAEVADCVGSSVTATKLRIWRARRALFSRAAADPVLAELLEGGQE